MIFQSEKDKHLFDILKQFNVYDLYSKTDDIYDINCFYYFCHQLKKNISIKLIYFYQDLIIQKLIN